MGNYKKQMTLNRELNIYKLISVFVIKQKLISITYKNKINNNKQIKYNKNNYINMQME